MRALRDRLGFGDPFRRRERPAARPAPPYSSQDGQDELLHRELFGDGRRGIFVDVGAHDGISFSNTYFFETGLGWDGICVEPNPQVFARLQKNRRAKCICSAIAAQEGRSGYLRVDGYAEMLSGLVDSYDPRHRERIQREVESLGGRSELIDVPTLRLEALLAEHGIESFDLLCLDVEGAEVQIVEALDWSRVRPRVVCLENNYRDPRVWRVMRRARYRAYARIGQDEIYLRSGFESARSH